jgi:NADPH:quinone reductase
MILPVTILCIRATRWRTLGCDHVLVLPRDTEDLVGKVREWTGGRGVAIAYDSIGQATFDLSLASLARFGLLVSYGWASGEVAPVQLSRLREQGSVFLTRPTVSHYTEARSDLLEGAARVFSALERSLIRPTVFKRLPLERAGEAHALLESGENSGPILLEPA